MQKLNYKLKKYPIKENSFNHLIDYLVSVGIDRAHIGSFIKAPKESDNEPYANLENIEEMIDALHINFEKNKHFFLQVDSDADGITSAAIFYSYFKTLYPNANIEYRLHEEKEHGVIVDTVPIVTDVVVIPDAGTNQYEEQRELVQQGRTVLIMDHHMSDNFEKIDGVIVVNNQLSPNFKNKALSGAGVVYKVIEAFSHKYGDGVTHLQFMDLAAVGILSDMMDSKNLDNNYIIHHGLKKIYNPLLKYMMIKQERGIKNLASPTKLEVVFYLSPLINGMIRSGTVEEKTMMFKAFVEYNNTQVFTRTYRNVEYAENLYELAARICGNVKGKQDRGKKKALESMVAKIEMEKLHHNQIIIIKTERNEVSKTLTGLIANEIVKIYDKPTLILRPVNKEGSDKLYYAGSGRGKKAFGFTSFRDYLNDSKFFEYAEGHGMAFGAEIAEDKIKDFIEYSNEVLREVDFGSNELEVDYVFKNNINVKMLQSFAETDIYGNGIPEPLFAFELKMNKSELKTILKNKKWTTRFMYDGIVFIKFNDTELADAINNIQTQGALVKVVGRPQINEYNGYKNVQIAIDFIEIEEFKKVKLF